MKDDIFPILRKLLAERGTWLLDAYTLVRNLLADFVPQHRAARNLLVLRVQEGIAKEISDFAGRGGMAGLLLRGRWSKRLQTEHGLAERNAAGVVEIWMQSLFQLRATAPSSAELPTGQYATSGPLPPGVVTAVLTRPMPEAVLQGHTEGVLGALARANSRILSWWERTLSLWLPNGSHTAVLEGHTGAVNRAFGLTGGRIVSWSIDSTLCLRWM